LVLKRDDPRPNIKPSLDQGDQIFTGFLSGVGVRGPQAQHYPSLG